MNQTKIEWTDLTYNPIIGCHHIGPGCDHCYAEKMANRIAHMNSWIGEKYREVVQWDTDGKWTGTTIVADSHMDFPRTLKKPRKIFVGSMTDIFLHSQSTDGRQDVVRLFNVFKHNPQHTFQILTKRPHAAKLFSDYMMKYGPLAGIPWPLPNVWLGVTVSNQEEANFKIPILLNTPAAKRFVSIEPMLGKIDLVFIPKNTLLHRNALTGHHTVLTGPRLAKRSDYVGNKLDWVIVGGETGPGARRMEAEWPAIIAGQCENHHVPFFFKSWGSKYNMAERKKQEEMNDWVNFPFHTFKQFPI